MNPQQSQLPPPPALVEQGKLHAIGGEHEVALLYYRAALQMTTGMDNKSRLLARYYAECALESFEHLKDYERIFAYCRKALAYYKTNPPSDHVAWKGVACVHQRKGVVSYKSGDREGARETLRTAANVCREQGLYLPVVEILFQWILSGLEVEAKPLEKMLLQYGYYSVTRQTVRTVGAKPLPPEVLQRLKIGQSEASVSNPWSPF